MIPEQAALLKKARDSLRAARVLADQEHLYDFAVSRAYYTIFYAAEAFLLGEGLAFSKHSAVIGGRPRKRKGRTDYLLCLPVGQGQSPLAVAIIEAKKEREFPTLGIQQSRDYRQAQQEMDDGLKALMQTLG